MLRIDVLTLFPEMVRPFLEQSILGRAQTAGQVMLQAVDLRQFTEGKHRIADDTPYGGGAGMVIKPEPIARALAQLAAPETKILMMSPRGRTFGQNLAHRLAQEQHLILIAGHYEGVDERVLGLCHGLLSIGDFVLTGGELPAAMVADAIVRLVPGVIRQESLAVESFAGPRLEAPHYTRPLEFQGQTVPEVLRSGHHALIQKYRSRQSLLLTRCYRPELLFRGKLSAEDIGILSEPLVGPEPDMV